MASKARKQFRKIVMDITARHMRTSGELGFRMSASNGEGVIDIYDTIGSDPWSGTGMSGKEFKKQLGALGAVPRLTLRINSPGGDVMDGFTIYNLLCEHPADKTAIIDGMAASIASVLCMACDTVIMKEASFFMIHNPYMWTMGGSDQLRQDANTLDQMKTLAVKAYQRKTDLSETEISDLMDGGGKADGTWMTPQDALDLGFIDEIDTGAVDCDPKDRVIHKGKLQIPDDIMQIMQGKKPPVARMLAATPKPNLQQNTQPNNSQPNTQPILPIGALPPKQGVKMQTCPHCGKEVSEGLAFCGHCGGDMKVTPAIAMKAAHDREVQEAKDAAAKTERDRIVGIQAICGKFGMAAEFQAELINGKDSLEVATRKVAEAFTPLSPGVGTGTAVTKDAADQFQKRALLSLVKQSASKYLTAKEIEDVKGVEPIDGLHGLARECLFNEGAIPGRQIANMNPSQLADHFIRLAGVNGARMEASSELSAILADVANKVLERSAALAMVTYDKWTGVVQSKDFKPLHMANLSEFSDIKDIAEGKDFEFGRVSDKQEIVSLSTKGIAHVLTRKTIINDDLGALTRIPAAIANAWERRKNYDVYQLLTSASLAGPTMTEDGLTLFAAGHGNALAHTGTVTHAAIGKARLAMQKIQLTAPDAKSNPIYSGNVPKYLVTGVNNRTSLEQLLGSVYDPQVAGSAIAQTPNLFRDIVPICDVALQAMLDAAGGSNQWYMATDPLVAPHIVVNYLQGIRVPFIRSMPSLVSQALGIKWDIFGEYGVGLADWRTMISCDGAA